MRNPFHLFLFVTSLAMGQDQSGLNYLAEGFEDNKNAWDLASTSDYQFKIENGHLFIDAYTTAVHELKNVGATKEDAFGLHTRMLFLKGTSEGWMGVRFGVSEDATRYLTFCYNNAQGFLVSMRNGKKYEVLRESKSTVVKPYDYNTLTVIKSENSYRFLINDKQVFQDEIKPFFGPLAGLFVSDNMSIQVDEFQVFDPKKGKQKIVASQATMAKTTEKDVSDIVLSESNMPDDFRLFFKSFEKYGFPYDFSTVIAYGKEISQLPFVQNNFYQYDLSGTRNHQVWALSMLSACQAGYTFLIADQWSTGMQEIFKCRIVAFDNKGKSLGSKDVGSWVKENGAYYQTLHFRASQAGSSITFNVEETYFNGNVMKKLVSFNGDICNLNSDY